MEYISYLSMDNPKLALAELEAVIPEIVVMDTFESVVLFRSSANPSEIHELCKRLAYTHKVGKVLASPSTYKLLDDLKQIPWKELYKDSFWVTVEKKHRTSPITTPDVARIIAAALQSPKGDSVNPQLNVYVYVTEKKSVVSTLIYENEKAFNTRKPQFRPAHHPASINPKLARALVNLSGLHQGIVWDPFCGVGGILIEAGLMGLYCKGSDISSDMIDKAQTNLDHYGIRRYSLSIGDATTMEESADVVITDVPYGKATKNITSTLYKEFLKNIRTQVKQAIVVFPSTANLKQDIQDTGWEIQAQYDYYLHRSLSKVIVVLKRK